MQASERLEQRFAEQGPAGIVIHQGADAAGEQIALGQRSEQIGRFAIPGAERRVTIIHFLDHDPRADWDRQFAAHGARVDASGLGRLELCAPFIPVVHGTDRLQYTGERIVALAGTPATPIVLTGAMRPYELRATDALQNFTEALLAVQILPPGVYVAMHNQVLQFPGVVKDRALGTFVKAI